jgi:flagellar biosynthesis/type III secretory pathway protein FliH
MSSHRKQSENAYKKGYDDGYRKANVELEKLEKKRKYWEEKYKELENE